MYITPVHQSVAKLLGGSQTFRAPRFQRNYAWGDDEIAAFLRDLDSCRAARRLDPKNKRHHFFGGLVTVDAPEPGSSRSNLEVIDGQQRLATFLMLINQLKQAYAALARSVAATEADFSQVLAERARLLAMKYEIYTDEVRLQNIVVPRVQLSAPDQPFFAALMDGRPLEPTRRSHAALSAAYERIGIHLAEIVAGAATTVAKAEELHTVHEIFQTEWTVIHMAASSKTDAYMLFQVMNDRGIGLSEGELLRSTTLEALEPSATAGQMQEVEARWNTILAGEIGAVVKALSWVYASHVGGWPRKGSFLQDYIGALFPMLSQKGPLGTGDTRDLVEAIRNLDSDVERVHALAAGEWPLPPNPSITAWHRNRLRLLTRHLAYVDCIPLLLAACQLKPKTFNDIVFLLERFAFRHIVVGGATPEPARTLLNRHAVNFRRDPAAFKYADLRRDLRDLCNASAPDEAFRRDLRQLRYTRSGSTKPLKYLLMTLEDFVRWYDDNPQGEPTCRDETHVLDFETGTIEHVYAENAHDPDPAIEPLVDSLGNLTFLSGPENDAAGAKGFERKRPYFLKSATMLNRQIAAETAWTATVVEARADRLIGMALQIFAL